MLKLIVLASVAVAAAVLYSGYTAHSARHESCVAIQNLNTVITATLKRSRRNLPKLTYFQKNPRELRAQLAEIDRELVVFRPRTCN